ncbi:inhibitor of growth protein 3 [Etheostoma cragini]|uniref:inhibitor of growth protein 3 n=1 Tax=Etheostoma cragini TaxID=417921 RepID=UPI00155F07B9|nr:inhibitor of growth protein 3 [Etheostoma cragini]
MNEPRRLTSCLSLSRGDATDQLEQKVIEFFVNAKKNKPEWREEQMEVIKKDYYKALEDADEKVQLANQIYDLVSKGREIHTHTHQATTQMKEGRRTSSLKASYEAIKNNDFQLGREFSLTRDNPGYTSSALANTLTQTLTPPTAAAASDSRGRKSKSSIKSSNHQSSSSSSSSSLSSCSSSSALAQELSQHASALPEAEANSQVDWTYDPNEPRYCICNQVSYGEMVGCDNTDCPIEWFHYGCVGLTEAPKGKWFCPQCTAAMKRRGSRHK